MSASTPTASSASRCPCQDTQSTEYCKNPLLRRFQAWTKAALAPLQMQSSDAETLLNLTTLHIGQKERLADIARRLLLCEQPKRILKFVALGASVTYGHGLSPNFMAIKPANAWPAILQRALREIWDVDVQMSNKAAAGTTAPFAALCYDALVPEDADVVFIEYGHTTRNDAALARLIEATLARGALPIAVDYQHLVKRTAFVACGLGAPPGLERPRSDARICVLNTKLLRMVETQAVARKAFASRDLPMVSTLPLLQWFHGKLMGADSSSVARVSDLKRFVSPDGGHATRAAHHFMAAMSVRLLWLAQDSLLTAAQRGAPSISTLPPVRVPRGVCSIGNELQRLVVRSNGWDMLTENDKTGLAATQVGSETVLRVPIRHCSAERNVPNAYVQGPMRVSAPTPAASAAAVSPYRLFLTYLTSYEHMGVAQLSCSDGCSCERSSFDAHRPKVNRSLHLTSPAVALNISSSYNSSCTNCSLRLRVLSRSQSGEHKFKLVALTLVPPDLNTGAKKLTFLFDHVDRFVLNRSS